MMTGHYCYRKWKKYQRKKAHQRCARERASLRDGMRKVILSIIRSLVSLSQPRGRGFKSQDDQGRVSSL